MGFSAPSALNATEALTHTWLNDIIAGLQTIFDHGIEPDAFEYPLKFEGLIDFGPYRLKGITLYNGVVFADSYDTLADAVADLPAGGGMILLGSKEYILSATLDLSAGDTKSNVILVGMGRATKISAGSGFTGTRLIALSDKSGAYRQRMGVYNMSIDTQGTNSLIAVDCSNTEDAFVSNVHFQDDSSSGSKAVVLSECGRASVVNCDILSYDYGIYKELMSVGTPGHGPVGPDTNYHIAWNIIRDCITAGIYLKPTSEMMLLYGNTIESMFSTCTGIHLEDTGVFGVRSFIVDSNVITGRGGGLAINYGIYIKCSTAATSNNREYGIHNNVIRLTTEHGIYLEGNVSGNLRSVPVTGNIIYRAKKHGIYIYGTAVSNNVNGNIILNPSDGTDDTYSGVCAESTAANNIRWCQFQNNLVLYDDSDGIGNAPQAGFDFDQLVAGTGVVGKCMIAFNAMRGTHFYVMQAPNGNVVESNIPA